MNNDHKKPFKIKDVTRNIKKSMVASTLEEMRLKVAVKFEKANELPTIHLDSDGTEIDDEEYFRTLEPNTDLIAVFNGEHWIDPTLYVTISTHHERTNSKEAAAKAARIKDLVTQLQSNLCHVSVISDADLELLTNMDPNSLVDITGKDINGQWKDPGRPMCAKGCSDGRLKLLQLLKDGAIFCSERYPEEAEAIDLEIRRQLNAERSNDNDTRKAVSNGSAQSESSSPTPSTTPSPTPAPTPTATPIVTITPSPNEQNGVAAKSVPIIAVPTCAAQKAAATNDKKAHNKTNDI